MKLLGFSAAMCVAAFATLMAALAFPPLLDVSIALAGLGFLGLLIHCVMIGSTAPAIAFGALIAIIVALPAYAAEPGATATLAWGDLVAEFAHIASAVLVPLLIILLGKMPGPLGLVLRTFLGERLIRNAVDYAVNAIEGATKGKTLSVPVGSVVLAEAVQYALDQGAPWLVKTLGGPDGIKQKIFRALDLDEDASAEKLGVSS